MPTFEEVTELVKSVTAYDQPLTESTTLQSDIGVAGVDMDHLLAAYSKRFGVDLSSYIWYFHTCEEFWNIGGLFFPPPNMRVKEIPITLAMLHHFAVLGRWAVEYPPHEPPRHRPDIWFNLVLVLTIAAIVIICGVRRCSS